nr:MAG TPA: hypothetical protein [Bacteriophage sp.]
MGLPFFLIGAGSLVVGCAGFFIFATASGFAINQIACLCPHWLEWFRASGCLSCVAVAVSRLQLL